MLLEKTERNRASSLRAEGIFRLFSNPFIGLLPGRYYLEDSTGFRRQRFRPHSSRIDGEFCKRNTVTQRW
jgi:hypothetical protein